MRLAVGKTSLAVVDTMPARSVCERVSKLTQEQHQSNVSLAQAIRSYVNRLAVRQGSHVRCCDLRGSRRIAD
jgi:hypothetical protein